MSVSVFFNSIGHQFFTMYLLKCLKNFNEEGANVWQYNPDFFVDWEKFGSTKMN